MQGDHIVERSSEELFSGDLQKISKGHSQERHFTLFDHQLIYCKRVSFKISIIKCKHILFIFYQEAIGHKLQYRGRIIMDNCKIIDLADGEGMVFLYTCAIITISYYRNLQWQSC